MISMIISPLPVVPSPTLNSPTSTFPGIHGSTDAFTALLSRASPECADISQFRTTTNIVLSCLSTILACTWVALHLNTPKSYNSAWKSFWRKLGWMIVALITPELIGGIAIKERLAAKKYMEEWNANFMSLCSPETTGLQGKALDEYERKLKDKKYDSHWTLTHGFLAGMGGIRLYGGGKDKPQKFRPGSKIFEDPNMRPIIQEIGLISTSDIEDKSKGDWMTKFFVVIQTTWFIIQCLARWAAHLPVTELEVVTLAYAVQNIFIYFLWWRKPQSLCVPFRIYLEKDAEPATEPTAENKEQVTNKPATKPVNDEEEIQMLLHSMNSNVVHDLDGSNTNRCSPSPNIPDEGPNANSDLARSDTRLGWSRKGLLAHEWVQPTHSGVQGFFIGLFSGDGYWLFLLLAGTIFGALHLIPLWLSIFPSDKERQLWRASAFYVTVAPMGLPLAIVLIMIVINIVWCHSDTNDVATGVTAVFGFCALVVYAVARFILLVLPFTTLRSLPKEAFLNVEWTRFIPHF